MQTFEELGLSEETLRAIKELGFETPSDIQKEAIPALLGDNIDMIGLAQTGTGKTAAFGLPLIEKVDPSDKSTQALILAPTRELGRQIAEQIALYSKYQKKLSMLAVYGGADIYPQIKALKKPQHIIVATPGRLIDLIKRKAVKLKDLKYLILDEADEMLNMGFKEEIDEILQYTPEDKLTWLFSATMPPEIKRIVDTYMDMPREIRVNATQKVNERIKHYYSIIKRGKKEDAIKRFLDLVPDIRGVVFCRTRQDSKDLADALLKQKYRADALHGDLSQAQRDRVMRRFKNNELQVLVATDVAARGIDVNDLTHVFHYTLPDQLENYTHRSGRTARAGKDGTSIAFVYRNDRFKIKSLQRALKIQIEELKVPIAEDIVDVHVRKWKDHLLSRYIGGKVKKELYDEMREELKDIGRDELLARLIVTEIDKLDLENDQDLNDQFASKSDRNDRPGKGNFKKRGKGNFSKGKPSFRKKKKSGDGGKRTGDFKKKDFDKSRYRKKKSKG